MKKEAGLGRRITASNKFVTILALVSIIGFAGIVSETLFNYSIRDYITALWMFIIGIGFIFEGQLSTLKRVRVEGLTPTNFTHLITLIIGLLAIFTGIFSLPQISLQNQGFLAVKGIVSIVAILVIVVQTWVVR